jgi:ATP-dependent Zn protease
VNPTKDTERLTAIHEAAHAVMAELCGEQITRVEIVGDSEHTGTVESLRFPANPEENLSDEETARAARRRIKCVLAGIVAEAVETGRQEWDDSSEDLDHAVRLAMQVVDDCEDVVPLLDDIRVELDEELRANWQGVEVLAVELMHRKSLTGSRVRKMLSPFLEG